MFHLPISILLSRYWWWVALFGILLIVGLLCLLSYSFSLPYIDHPDEPTYYYLAQGWRGLPDFRGDIQGYPPAYLALHTVIQPIVEFVDSAELVASIRALRFVAIIANLGTMVFIALTARLAAGDIPALIAATAWGISPLIFREAMYATPDPFVYLTTAAALYFTAAALCDKNRAHWCVWSVAAGLLATLFKYNALPAVLPGCLVALIILGHERRRGIGYLATQAAMIFVVGFFLVFIYGAGSFGIREADTFKSEGFSNLFRPEAILNNIYQVFIPLQPAAFFIICGLGILALLLSRHLVVKLKVAALCLVLIISLPWIAASYVVITPGTRLKDALPATAAACVLMSMGWQQIVATLPRKWYSSAVVALPLILFIFIPQLREDWQIVQNRRLPDTRVALRAWFDINLEPGTVLVDQDNHKTFNPIWGGIPYRQWVDWIETDSVMSQSIREWREAHGISYMEISRIQIEDMNKTEEGRAYLANLLHLRDFFAPPATRGPEMGIYRLWRMENETQIQFGEHIVLTGYDQSATPIKSGENLILRFYWQPKGTPDDNYSLFIHLVPNDVYEIIAQVDGAPAVAERPTLTWNELSETLVSPPFNLTIPADLAPGNYRIFIGLYNYTTLQRLTLEDGSDAWMLGTITVSD